MTTNDGSPDPGLAAGVGGADSDEGGDLPGCPFGIACCSLERNAQPLSLPPSSKPRPRSLLEQERACETATIPELLEALSRAPLRHGLGQRHVMQFPASRSV